MSPRDHSKITKKTRWLTGQVEVDHHHYRLKIDTKLKRRWITKRPDLFYEEISSQSMRIGVIITKRLKSIWLILGKLSCRDQRIIARTLGSKTPVPKTLSPRTAMRILTSLMLKVKKETQSWPTLKKSLACYKTTEIWAESREATGALFRKAWCSVPLVTKSCRRSFDKLTLGSSRRRLESFKSRIPQVLMKDGYKQKYERKIQSLRE